MTNSHYRGPINYTPDSLAQADAALERLYLALRGVPAPLPQAGEVARRAGEGSSTERFVAAMDDDFNTPIALAELQSMAREVNTAKAAGDMATAARVAAELRALAGRLALLGQEPEAFLRKRPLKQAKSAVGEGDATPADSASLSDTEIEQLIVDRATARKSRDFKESDRIRDLLAASGVLLEDQPGGKTLWRRG
jgi:cysteinyl-tRNA synthetase